VVNLDRPPLTRARVVETALSFVDDNGLAALSMRKLGGRLGVEAMSLYNHVDNKDDLLRAIVVHLLDMVEIPDSTTGSWRVHVEAMTGSFRTVGLALPEAFTLLVGRRPGNEDLDAHAPLVAVYARFRQAGLDIDESAKAFHALAGYVVGFVLMEGGVFGESEQEIDVDAIPEDKVMLREFCVANDGTEQDELFEAGLALFLDGLEGRVLSAVANPDT